MLSDAEQRQLTAIEFQLRVDDPDFVELFTDGRQRRSRGGWRGRVALITFVLTVIAIGIGLAVGSVIMVVIALTTVGALSGWWITGRRRRRP
ncbi:DUF3040 domain-containing protein [Paractinoplanes rishiriensis]|uniref:DUF3040 domain-containing protein n=1 Tax=Paractinoplanes rishiriensis TaxID=1050105 RepID=A0A919MUZ9_9ACTN|nr:DUF3040 domain-containing protein [Actinoplanes rishiriensis]GIF00867.1 hypothetical protein Ari01nite_83310 [Actinoplanes rishiriensis]